MGFWIVAAAGFALWIWFRYSFQGDLNCPVPGTSDSTYGKSSWQWFPPGEVCAYPGTDIATDYPSTAGGVVGIFLVVVPLVVLPLWIWSEVRIRDLVNRSTPASRSRPLATATERSARP